MPSFSASRRPKDPSECSEGPPWSFCSGRHGPAHRPVQRTPVKAPWLSPLPGCQTRFGSFLMLFFFSHATTSEDLLLNLHEPSICSNSFVRILCMFLLSFFLWIIHSWPFRWIWPIQFFTKLNRQCRCRCCVRFTGCLLAHLTSHSRSLTTE